MRRLLVFAGILSVSLPSILGPVPVAHAQMVGTAAARDSSVTASLALHFDQFTFLDVVGMTLRADVPAGARLTPFFELSVGRFEADLSRVQAAEATESSYVLGAGTKVFLFGERTLRLPIAVAAYTRVQLGLLENIDLLGVQALLLATWDLSDRVPLLITFGAGGAYRESVADVPGGNELRVEESGGRYVFSIEVPLDQHFSALAEYGYEERGSGGIAVKYRF